MSSYAEFDDVVARAGRARVLFGKNDAPDEAEIERFLVDASAIVDARLAASGVTLPITNAAAIAALTPITADGALVLALSGTLASDEAVAAYGKILDMAQARWLAALGMIEDGNSPIIAILVEEGDGGTGGASNFWSNNPQYDLRTRAEAFSLSPSIRPSIRRGMGL